MLVNYRVDGIREEVHNYIKVLAVVFLSEEGIPHPDDVDVVK